MKNDDAEYSGSADQRAMMRRADALSRLIGDDPRFGSYGRSIAVTHDVPGQIGLQADLARVLGAAGCLDVPDAMGPAYEAELRRAGFNVDQFENWAGDESPVEAARAVLANRSLPDDLELVWVDDATSRTDFQALGEMTGECGVLLPMGSYMRGQRAPAVCVYARDRNGAPVCSSAAVVMFAHRKSASPVAWWGMLATDASRRGEGLALILGAQSILAMHERFGIDKFFTGIRTGNAPSQGLCRKLGLQPSGELVIAAIDPTMFSGGRMTK